MGVPASDRALCRRRARRPSDDAMELAPCPVKTIADGDDLIGEHCRLRDLDAIQGVIAGVVVDPPFGVVNQGHVDLECTRPP